MGIRSAQPQVHFAQELWVYWGYPKGPCTQYLGTWDLGNGNSSTGFGYVYDYWVLGPLGLYSGILGVVITGMMEKKMETTT